MRENIKDIILVLALWALLICVQTLLEIRTTVKTLSNKVEAITTQLTTELITDAKTFVVDEYGNDFKDKAAEVKDSLGTRVNRFINKK